MRIQSYHCFIVMCSSKVPVSRAICNIIGLACDMDLHATASAVLGHFVDVIALGDARPRHSDIKIYSFASHQQSSVVTSKGVISA